MDSTVQRTLNLLVIDDDAAVAEYICIVAAQVGFRTAAACDGVDFSAPMEMVPDVVVLDLQMPGRDGVETLRDLAKQRPGAAVFLVSGLGERMLATASELALAQGLRVVGSLAKPFLFAGLLDMLRRAQSDLRDSAVPRPQTHPPVDPEALRNGIARDEIGVCYQPIVNLASGLAVAVEALARWQHPQRGLLMPGTFIPVAERHNLIASLNWSVLTTAIKHLQARFSRHPFPVSVNFTASDFVRLDLPDRVFSLIEAAGLPPGSLNIELTESAVIQDLPRTLDSMMRLRMKGIGLWLDDYGTGYSSMEQIRRLPITALKLDRSFMPTEAAWAENLTLARGLVEMAHKLGLPVIAEGVETLAQHEALREIGCNFAQGFYLAPPMPDDMLSPWLDEASGISKPPTNS